MGKDNEVDNDNTNGVNSNKGAEYGRERDQSLGVFIVRIPTEVGVVTYDWEAWQNYLKRQGKKTNERKKRLKMIDKRGGDKKEKAEACVVRAIDANALKHESA